jgi:hypothetical protein
MVQPVPRIAHQAGVGDVTREGLCLRIDFAANPPMSLSFVAEQCASRVNAGETASVSLLRSHVLG